MTRAQIIARLEEIASRVGFVYILAILIWRELFVDPSDLADIDWREALSFQELTFLTGLMVKHPITMALPGEEETAAALAEIKLLFRDMHSTYQEPLAARMREMAAKPLGSEDLGSSAKTAEEIEALFGSGEVMAEPIFYGGSGAYDFQYAALARTRYETDTGWLRANKGFSISDVWEIPRRLKTLAEHNERARPQPTTFTEFCEYTLAVFCFSKCDLGVPDDVALGYLRAFVLAPGTTNAKFDNPGQYNSAASHPIIRLDESRYFVPIHFLLAESLYESPFYWMLRDRAYRGFASANRGKATEHLAYEMLRPLFGAGLLRDVIVKRAKSETATDIDLLAIVGNKAIVIQAKSKRLTELSRQGDTTKLKEDFSLAVQDAYDQGQVCRDAILSRNSTLVSKDGHMISLSESIDDVYVVCLTSDDYPALTAQVDNYLRKPSGAPPPVAMSIFDLEIAAYYLHDPFEFSYYLRQRIALSDHFTANSELAFLGFHLRTKLFRMKDCDRCFLDDQFSQLIDASYPALMGYQPHTETVERLRPKWKNAKFDRLINEIKSAGDPGFTDAIFYLYDLSSDGADELIRHIEKALARSRQTDLNSDFSLIFENGRSGISFVAYAGNRATFDDTVMTLGRARKYKTKADVWLAIGTVVGSSRMIDMAAFSKVPWQYDLQMELFTQASLKTGTALGPKGRKVGRNDKCVCGSGKKFKKCCGST